MSIDTERLTVRGVDPGDVDALKAAAAAAGQSLNTYLRELLHARARMDHNRAALASLPSEPAPELLGYDAAAEIRAIRDEREAHIAEQGPAR